MCRASPGNLRFVSVEPLHEELNIRFSRSIDWIILGAETGSRKGKIVPERKWVQQIIVNARKNKTPIFRLSCHIPFSPFSIEHSKKCVDLVIYHMKYTTMLHGNYC